MSVNRSPDGVRFDETGATYYAPITDLRCF